MKFFVLVLLFISIISANDFDTYDKVLFTSFCTLSIIDALNTNYSLKTEKCKEVNFLLGEKPGKTEIYTAKLISISAIYFLGSKLDTKKRKYFFILCNTLYGALLYHNYKMSQKMNIQFKFQF